MQLHSYRHIFARVKIETIYLLILYIAMKNENPALEKYAELMIEKMKKKYIHPTGRNRGSLPDSRDFRKI